METFCCDNYFFSQCFFVIDSSNDLQNLLDKSADLFRLMKGNSTMLPMEDTIYGRQGLV